MAIADNPIKGVGSTSSNTAPIQYTVGGVTKDVRAPASYVWKLNDVSAADSGRTEDTKMYKNRVGQVVGIELSWTNLPTAEASAIINAFDAEYFYVEYLDLKAGGYVTSQFYCGDRTAPLYNAKLGLWSNVSFNLIKRKG